MRKRTFSALLLVMLLAKTGLACPQSVEQNLRFTISGQPGEAAVLQINGRSYVDIEALARLTNGSLSFRANQITLNLSPSAANTPTTTPAAGQSASSEFSKEFVKAGIEEMSVIREWRSALVNAVRNGLPRDG